jgi:hypothetical protein
MGRGRLLFARGAPPVVLIPLPAALRSQSPGGAPGALIGCFTIARYHAGVTELCLLAFSVLCAIIALVLFVRLRLQARAARVRASEDGVGSMRDALERRLEKSSEPWV